jgi:hypothetical protein
LVTSMVMEIRKGLIYFDSDDYDYMDSMPLKGWIWEIIRRGEGYKQEYDKLETAIKSEQDIREKLNVFLLKAHELGVDCCSTSDNTKLNKDYFLAIEVEESSFMVIPKPQSQYRFLIENPISINGESAYNILNSINRKFYDKFIDRATRMMSTKKFSDPHTGNFLLRALTLNTPGNTIYIGISKKAKDEDIKQLTQQLRTYLKPDKPRIRDDKWKFYLICYDIKKQGFSYEEIADSLIEVYRDNEALLDTRNIENYYKNALELINGDYKKYLY